VRLFFHILEMPPGSFQWALYDAEADHTVANSYRSYLDRETCLEEIRAFQTAVGATDVFATDAGGEFTRILQRPRRR
jgi:hypothetical protein